MVAATTSGETRDVKEDDDAPVTFGRRVWRWAKEFFIIVGSALVLSFIIKTFFFQSFWIPSSSMEETLDVGDRILVTKWRPGPLDLRRGDIVVFRDPDHWLNAEDVRAGSGPDGFFGEVLAFTGLLPADAGEHLVKRVIGLPGDTVECRSDDGQVYVNGEPLVEDYIAAGSQPCSGYQTPWTVTVPAGSLWVMGDNRSFSADSRFHLGSPGGPFVPVDNVVGTAFATVWPLDHWQGIGNPLASSSDPAATD